jgi:MFS family permease
MATTRASTTSATTTATDGIAEDILHVPVITQSDVQYASIVAFCAWVFSVYDFIMFGVMLPVIAEAFGWTTDFAVFMNTIVTVGSVIVALTVGPITDYFGRKNALTIVTAGAAFSSGLMALAFHPIYIVIVRALSGFGYSEQAVNTTYLSEMYGKDRRGFFYGVIQGGWPIGVVLAVTINYFLLPYIGWRGVFAVATLPAVIIVLLRLRLKESPRFAYMQAVRKLLKLGRLGEARAVGEAHGIDVERSSAFTYRQLFQEGWRKHTLFVALAYGVQWIGSPMFVILATTVLTQGKGLTFENSLLLLIVPNLVGFLGYVVLGYISDKVSRRNLVAFCWVVAGVLWAVMILWAQDFTSIMVLFSASAFFEAGSYAPMFTYLAESYPTRMRGSGVAFTNAIGQIGGIIGSAAFGILLASGHSVNNAAWILGLIPLLIAAVLLFGARNVAPRTTLEAIAR